MRRVEREPSLAPSLRPDSGDVQVPEGPKGRVHPDRTCQRTSERAFMAPSLVVLKDLFEGSCVVLAGCVNSFRSLKCETLRAARSGSTCLPPWSHPDSFLFGFRAPRVPIHQRGFALPALSLTSVGDCPCLAPRFVVLCGASAHRACCLGVPIFGTVIQTDYHVEFPGTSDGSCSISRSCAKSHGAAGASCGFGCGCGSLKFRDRGPHSVVWSRPDSLACVRGPP